MIMPRGQQLLLPANPSFMLFTMVMALLLDMMQSMALFGNAAWTPDWVALLLVFWGVHQPLKVGVGISFFLGLLTDVHQTSVLGQHAFPIFGIPQKALDAAPIEQAFVYAITRQESAFDPSATSTSGAP
jgi:hypothetical protein